jgi:predicted dehydrogenase
MKIAVVGYGAIGHERVKALQQLRKEGYPIDKIRVYDPNAKEGDIVDFYPSWIDLEKDNPDFVIVATPHDVAVEIVKEVLSWDSASKILMEKPFGRNWTDAKSIYTLFYTSQYEHELFVGFNYRFFEGIEELVYDWSSQKFGEIISINMEIGHGGNPDMINSWKLNPSKGGVNVLLDPGIHALDLLGYFCKDTPIPVWGKHWSGFWKNGLSEEVGLMLEDDKVIINLKSSIVKWRNTFKIEINGTEGYGIVEGRGGNYGPQTYIRGKRWGWQNGKSQKESEELVVTSDCKDSFKNELEFILFGQKTLFSLSPCSVDEAMQTMELYNECMKVIE